MTIRKDKKTRNPLLDSFSEQVLDRIKTGLENPDRTQRGIAHTIGIVDSQASKLLANDRKLTVAEFYLVFHYLGIEIPSIDDLIKGSKRRKSSKSHTK